MSREIPMFFYSHSLFQISSLFNEAGIEDFGSRGQPEKAHVSIDFTEEGIVICANEVHL